MPTRVRVSTCIHRSLATRAPAYVLAHLPGEDRLQAVGRVHPHLHQSGRRVPGPALPSGVLRNQNSIDKLVQLVQVDVGQNLPRPFGLLAEGTSSARTEAPYCIGREPMTVATGGPDHLAADPLLNLIG